VLEPLTRERWARPIIKEEQDVTTGIYQARNMARREYEDASCEFCFDPSPRDEQEHNTTEGLDLYHCFVCNRSFPEVTGSASQKREPALMTSVLPFRMMTIGPTCINMTPSQKVECAKNSERVLIEVKLKPTWEH